jgi:hypothetical protein
MEYCPSCQTGGTVYPPRTFEKGLYLHHIDGVLSTIWRDGVVGVSIHGQLEDDFTPLSINPATLAHVWAAALEKKTHKTYYIKGTVSPD